MKKTKKGYKYTVEKKDGIFRVVEIDGRDFSYRFCSKERLRKFLVSVAAQGAEVEFAEQFKRAQDDVIEADVVKVVEVTQKRFGLTEGEKSGVLHHLIQGGDMNRFGLINAVTRTAQDVPDYDRSTELERLGGTILELPRRDWETIAIRPSDKYNSSTTFAPQQAVN